MSADPFEEFKKAFPKINDFVEDLGIKTPDKDTRTALQKLLSQMKTSTLQIPYGWIVEQLKDETISVKRLGKLADILEARYTEQLDEYLSGDGGHAYGRHVMVDRGDQEERLDAEGKSRVTRIARDGRDGLRYNAYIKLLKEKAPDLISEFVTNQMFNLLEAMKEPGGEYEVANSDRARRQFALRFIGDLAEELDGDGFSVSFDWRVAVANGGEVTVTCAPSITSVEEFKKIETEIEPKSGKPVEHQSYGPVQSFAGRNKLVIGPFTAASNDGDLAGLLAELDFEKLGVTQY